MATADSSAASLGRLQGYDSDASSEEDEPQQEKLLPPNQVPMNKMRLLVQSAPPIEDEEARSAEAPENQIFLNDRNELTHNPRLAVMEAAGQKDQLPEGPKKNMLSGLVEKTSLSDFHFDDQRLKYMSYSLDNRVDRSDEVPTHKRKRKRNDDSSDIEGYKGPWAKYDGEVEVARPDEETTKVLQEYLTKMKGRKMKTTEETPLEEKTIFHLKEDSDYQGRSWTSVPSERSSQLREDHWPDKCFVPKRKIFTWRGHNKAVNTFKLFPKSGHLLLSCSMDCKVKIWEVYDERRCCRTYIGHKQGVRDVAFNFNGDSFLSASYDRNIKLWDTESGQVKHTFHARRIPYCIQFHPDIDKQNYFICGCSDKKILSWDIRSGDIIQEYDRHMGAVNTITFIDNNRRFVSTSDDKTVRVWEWDIPVDFKYIAEPSLHAIPAAALSNNGKWFAGQAGDNQIYVFNVLNRMRLIKKRTFRGHNTAGYACGLSFSPDTGYICSGDSDGRLFVWDFKTHQLMTKIKAHDGVCIDVCWHPHETSKVITCGWDGLIHLFD